MPRISSLHLHFPVDLFHPKVPNTQVADGGASWPRRVSPPKECLAMTTQRSALVHAKPSANVCAEGFAANDDRIWPLDETAEALRHLGEDILNEPVPEFLLKILED